MSYSVKKKHFYFSGSKDDGLQSRPARPPKDHTGRMVSIVVIACITSRPKSNERTWCVRCQRDVIDSSLSSSPSSFSPAVFLTHLTSVSGSPSSPRWGVFVIVVSVWDSRRSHVTWWWRERPGVRRTFPGIPPARARSHTRTRTEIYTIDQARDACACTTQANPCKIKKHKLVAHPRTRCTRTDNVWLKQKNVEHALASIQSAFSGRVFSRFVLVDGKWSTICKYFIKRRSLESGTDYYTLDRAGGVAKIRRNHYISVDTRKHAHWHHTPGRLDAWVAKVCIGISDLKRNL